LYSDQNDRLVALAQSRCWSAVGSSIFHGGWDAFARYLLGDEQSSGKVRAYDISAMEASVSARIFEILYEWRNDSIHGEDALKEWFFKNKVYSKMLDPNGVQGFKVGSNPSGCINTLTDNTFVVIFCLLYHLVGKELMISPDSFDDEIVDAVVEHYDELPVKAMGDDTILADHPVWDGLEESTLELGFSFEKELPPSGNFPMQLHEAKFLNFGFDFDFNRNMWHFRPNFDKLFAGLFYYKKQSSWRLTLAKLYALRVMCSQHPRYRFELDSYIQYIWQDFDPELRSEDLKDSNGDELLPYKNLKSMYLTAVQCDFLVFGLEGLSEVVPPILQLALNYLGYHQDCSDLWHKCKVIAP